MEQDGSVNENQWAKTFRDLLVWKKSIDLVTNIYKLTSAFPQHEWLGVISQMRRASVSIPSNIAEGFGRKSKLDLIRFCQISMGSLFELQTQLIISRNLGYLKDPDFDGAIESSREIERMLSSFVMSLKGKQSSGGAGNHR